MDLQIALMLVQDGIVNGAIYALMALALVLVFSVTRVIFIPQGEFVAYAALAMAALQSGKLPPLLWMLLGMAALCLVVEAVRQARGLEVDWKSTLFWAVALPALAALMLLVVKPQAMWLQVVAVLLLVTPMGPLVYRLAFRPLAHATVLILLIVSVALHLAMVGLGLFFFGAEGSRTEAFSEARWDVGGLTITGQSVVILGVTALLVVAMYFFFERTIVGKALRATAINRVGARLMGIPTALSGDLSFALAALIGAVSGLLIAPVTTIYYDTGFLIGLKGFVAAIVGGLSSYPLALAGALLVGQLESFSSFWASAFKEVIVFTLIIPVLWWRSLNTHHVEDEE
ncbi:MAG: branched-chain amino acid ABC transporter permease [Ottowia sp.]|uniref:branched-chain amino acid ABC transporter permease n=1 Tax=Ottowia sp. TaxID=1898956 RepID=UPI001B3EF37C|nr:branched-chain amino acid ABC transporter permease [Ottowia sp.]MBP8860487.1 branched-chain amino acid ABC transporter permease [Ottowia sp.]MBP9522586.1 branched-chain amino acid ABC transporter permease [Ottowia sp.]HRN06307.1 branched-chain amino acid ABC transporter permease [Ottowia sp.]